MDGQVTDFETDANITVEELKREIESKIHVPVHRQRLIYKSKLLKEDQRLSDHITKDGEAIHLMAMSEEQARSRSGNQRESRQGAQPSAQPNAAGPGLFGQGAPHGAQGADPFSGMINGLFGNLMQGFGGVPGGGQPHTHFTTGTLDLSQLFGAPPSQSPASSNQAPSSDRRSRTHQSPVGTIHIQSTTTPIIRISSRSGSRRRSAGRESAATEENKNNRSTSGTRNTSRIALPHQHLFEANVISNELMGPGAAFPGPPLPPSNQPRNPVTLLGSYLTSLQFAMARINPYIWRAGELLQRENNIVNPIERAEAQFLVNQVGRAMEQTARALLLSAHYYRDLTLGEVPGSFRISNNPHQDFLNLNQRFCDSQFPGGASNEEAKEGSGSSSRPSGTERATRQSTFASAPTGSASSRSQPQPPHNPFGNLLQNILAPDNMNNMMGLLGNLGGAGGLNLGGAPFNVPNVSRQQPAAASAASSSQPSRDVHMASEENKEEAKGRENANREERKEQAQNRQESLNASFLNNLNNIASSGSNPLGQAFGSMLPMLSGALAGAGGNPLTQSIGSLFPESSGDSNTFIFKVLVNFSIQDLLAVMNGNYEVVTNLHPRTRDILLSDYMNGEDTPSNREAATTRIAEEVNSGIVIPEELQSHVVRGSDPLKIAKQVNKKHIKKLVDAILDIEPNPNDSSAFINRVKRLLRWWDGDFIDSLKPHFTEQLPDVLKLIRGNIEKMIRSIGDQGTQMMAGMFTDTIMQNITKTYNNYLNDKKREDEAEARELGISLDELYKRRRDSERESRMEVDNDEEPKIEEENVNPLQSSSSQPPRATHATPDREMREESKEEAKKSVEEKIEAKVEEEKDPEIKALLEEMEEDQSMLVVDPPSKKPKSRAYRALDVYYSRNIESGNSITEEKPSRSTAKDEAANILKAALKDCGFKNADIDKMLQNNEIPEEFVNHFKEVVKEEIKERKKDPEYEQGRFPELDKI